MPLSRIKNTMDDKLIDAEILLVEDDDFEAKAIKRAFRHTKITNRITRAGDGVEALEILRRQHPDKFVGDPVILLVDLNMPRMNGIEFLTEIRKDPKLKRLIAFVLTTSSDDQDINNAYDLNAAGYILKASAGDDFKKLTTLVDGFWTTVRMPRMF